MQFFYRFFILMVANFSVYLVSISNGPSFILLNDKSNTVYNELITYRKSIFKDLHLFFD